MNYIIWLHIIFSAYLSFLITYNYRSECMKLVAIYVQLNHINCIWWNCIHFSHVFSNSQDVRQHQIHQCGMAKHQLERRHSSKWWPIYRVFIRDSSSLSHKSLSIFFVDKTLHLIFGGFNRKWSSRLLSYAYDGNNYERSVKRNH